jgi:hypothetical protein
LIWKLVSNPENSLKGINMTVFDGSNSLARRNPPWIDELAERAMSKTEVPHDSSCRAAKLRAPSRRLAATTRPVFADEELIVLILVANDAI